MILDPHWWHLLLIFVLFHVGRGLSHNEVMSQDQQGLAVGHGGRDPLPSIAIHVVHFLEATLEYPRPVPPLLLHQALIKGHNYF